MLTEVRYLFEYIPLFIFARTLSALSFDSAVRAGKALGRLFFSIGGKRREMAINNISLSLGFDRSEAAAIAEKAFENSGATLAEFIKLPSLSARFFAERVEVEGFDDYLEAKSKGRGVLHLCAHFGGWELLGPTHRSRGEPISVVYRRTKNPYVDRFIDSTRRTCGLETIPHRNSAKKIMSTLKRGESVGILLDQHAIPKDAVTVDFLGRPAATNYGLALIALKTGAPVVPTFSIRKGDGTYRCVYEKSISLDRSGDVEKDIINATVMFNGIIERYIRAYPDQWFWIHNRWKV